MSISGSGICSVYKRYGGFMQTSPLTSEEQKYDDTCKEIDRLQAEIGSMSASLFTAFDLIWFSRFVEKLHMFPKQHNLDQQLADLQRLLSRLKNKASE